MTDVAIARSGGHAPGGRLFPDDRQRTLLQAALLEGCPALAAWRAAARWLDAARLDAGSRQLLPLVWANLTRQAVHDPQLDELAPVYQHARARVAALLSAARRPLTALQDAGIPTLVLKGAALVTAYYRDPAIRPMSDLDVLVPTSAAAAARDVLEAHGWSPRYPWSLLGVRMMHAALFDSAHGPPVDLHWHVFAECCRPADDAALWDRSIVIEVAGVHVRALSAADQLIHVCVHGEKWVHVPGIRWVADAVAVMRGAPVNWDVLVEEATRRRFVRRLGRQLGYLRDVVDAPVPARALAALASAPASRLERFEQTLGVRERRPSNSLLAHWFTHARSAPGGAVGALLTFPRYLQAIWHLDRMRRVPGAALSRALRRPGRMLSGPGRA